MEKLATTDKLSVLTTNVEKGGTGKTSFTYNLAEDTARNHTILLIDEDKSQNLTDRYENYHNGNIPEKSKISTLYKGQNVTPLAVSENIDILAGGPELATVEKDIESKPNNRLILLTWIIQNYEELNSKYDYIFIDTHNDEGLLAQNAWVASDLVVGVSDPSSDGFAALLKLGTSIERLRSELIEIRSGQSYLEAKYYFIGNKIKHNTNSSKEFLQIISNHEKYLGFIPDKELVNISNLEKTPLVALAEDPSLYRDHKKFFDQVKEVFGTILEKLDGGE